ncbi:MAG: hypothetical protein HDR57_01740 [Treponema sp.]|nr:hypothetical protein [Treponema sp.]
MFASCADNSDTDDENPSPALPANVGENPITKTIKLKRNDSDSRYLELNADGTARAIYVDDDEEDNLEEISAIYKYSYDAKKETITMILKKQGYYDSMEDKAQLLTYSEICSKLNEEYTVEKMREMYKYEYDENNYKEKYPEWDTYEKYEDATVKESGFGSFAALAEYQKQFAKNEFKAYFSAQITYAYKINGGKMTLTEKFTGVKNLINAECRELSGDGRISYNWASIWEGDDFYGGTPNTDKKTITIESSEDGEKLEATYTEDIAEETVTIKFKGKEYVYKFEGEEYIQVE